MTPEQIPDCAIPEDEPVDDEAAIADLLAAECGPTACMTCD